MSSDAQFKCLYDAFLREVAVGLLNFPFICQAYPTFRVHQPNNVAVFEFHRDLDYSHRHQKINIFLPQTAAYDTNIFWIESTEGKADYAPAECRIGGMPRLRWPESVPRQRD